MGKAAEQEVAVRLSPQWRTIAEHVASGKKNRDIARAMNLSEGTVKEYLNRIFRALGIGNRTALAMWWVKQQSGVGVGSDTRDQAVRGW